MDDSLLLDLVDAGQKIYDFEALKLVILIFFDKVVEVGQGDGNVSLMVVVRD